MHMEKNVRIHTRESRLVSGVLVVTALLLLVSTGLLVVMNGQLTRRLDEDRAVVENLSSQVEGLAAESSGLQAQNEHLRETLEEYQEKVRLYQAEILMLREIANLTDDNSSMVLEEKTVRLIAPAVIAEMRTDRFGFRRFVGYVGVATNLTLEAVPGRGRVLVNTRPTMGDVFQDTAVAAKETAEQITGTMLLAHDLVFSIEAPEMVPSVDGPSAGAAMTLMILSLIEERPIDPRISVTGTISSDGTMGPIGGVVEKAEAAEAAGAEIFCIPKGNEITEVQEPKEYRIGPFIVTRSTYVNVETKALIEEKTDLTVYVVENVVELAQIAINKGE